MSANEIVYWSGFDVCQPRRVAEHGFDAKGSIVSLFREASRDDLRSFDLWTRRAMANGEKWGCER